MSRVFSLILTLPPVFLFWLVFTLHRSWRLLWKWEMVFPLCSVLWMTEEAGLGNEPWEWGPWEWGPWEVMLGLFQIAHRNNRLDCQCQDVQNMQVVFCKQPLWCAINVYDHFLQFFNMEHQPAVTSFESPCRPPLFTFTFTDFSYYHIWYKLTVSLLFPAR